MTQDDKLRAASLRRELLDLVATLMEPTEFRLFLIRFFDDSSLILNLLPADRVPIAEFFSEALRALESRGHIDFREQSRLADFLTKLGGVRPQRWGDIQRLAARAAIPLPDSPPRLYLRYVDSKNPIVRRIFVSYAREDGEWAAVTAAALARADVECFLDVLSIRDGERFDERIQEEIDRVDRVILGWSVHASRSDWVRREYLQALRVREEEQAHRFLLIELLDDTPLPAELKTIQAVSARYRPSPRLEPMAELEPRDAQLIQCLVERLRRTSQSGARGPGSP